MRTNQTKIWALALGLSIMAGSVPMLSVEAASRVYRGNVHYTQALREADSYLQTGKFQAAENKYLGILKGNPNNLPARASAAMAQAELFKLDAAEKNADLVLSKQPQNAMAHMVKGIVYRNRTASLDMTYRARRDELMSQSVAALQQAISNDPKSPEVYNQLGVTYRFMGRNTDALAQFQKALELDSRYSEAMLNEGILRMNDGDVAGAKEQFNKALRLNSKNHMAHFRLGEAYLKEGNTHQALKSLNTALSLDKGNASIMSSMADAYEAQGNTSAAVAYYRRAIQSNPSYMPSYMGISDIFDKRGDGELAMSELRSALNVNPNYSTGRNRLGHLALTVDKPDQALQYYRESLKQNPNDPDAINGISQALTVIAQKQATWSQTMGADSDLMNAEASIQEALRMNPNDLRLHLANLRISQLAGKPAMSEAELNTLVNMAPRTESEQIIRGEALLSLGRYSESDQVFAGLIQQAGNNPDKLLIIGDTLKVNGDLQGARTAYQTTLAVDPANQKAQRGIQRIEKSENEAQKTLRTAKALNTWRRTGKESSLDYYEQALSQNPRMPEARLEVSKLYEKTDQYDKAARSYQFYMGLRPDMPEKERQSFQKKIAKLQEQAQKQLAERRPSTNANSGASVSPTGATGTQSTSAYTAPAPTTQAAER